MSPDPIENALAGHLRRCSSGVAAPPAAELLDRVVRHSAELGRRRRAMRAAVTSAAAVTLAVAGAVVLLPDDEPNVGTDSTRTSDYQGPASSGAGGVEPGAQAPAPPPLPFDQVPPTDEQLATTNEASDMLIRTCLDDAGFGGRPFPDEGPLDLSEDLVSLHLPTEFGVFDEGEVRDHGYVPRQVQAEAELRGWELADEPTFTERWGADLVPTWQACQHVAGEQLRGGPQDMASPDHPVNVTGPYWGQAWDGAIADERTAAAVAAWSGCMAGQGYDYAHPLDPFDAFAPGDLATGDPLAPPAEEELATGLVDVACKAEVGFMDVWYGVLAEHQQAVIDAHPDELEAAARWHDDVYARAVQVLAGG
jgi:hypothetical protein